jgi:hypothetical protein
MGEAAKKPGRKKAPLKDMVAAPQVRPTLGAIADHFFAQIGGPEAFAKHLADDFQAALPGSLARTKIIDIVARVLKNEDDKHGLGDDLGVLSDEDLLREIERREALLRPYIGDANGEQPGRPGPTPQPAAKPPAAPAANPDHAAATAPPATP